MRSWVRCLVAALGATTIMSALAASDGAGSTDDVVARLSDLLNAKDAVAAFARVAADDELVGRTAPVPLDMLMDQRTYGLSLKLKDGSGDRRNSAGKRGGLQVSLALSER